MLSIGIIQSGPIFRADDEFAHAVDQDRKQKNGPAQLSCLPVLLLAYIISLNHDNS